MDILQWLGIALGFVIIAIMLQILSKAKKKGNVADARHEILLAKYKDLKNTAALLMINKESGILVYKKIYKNPDVFAENSEIFGGLIQAVALIGRELGNTNVFSRLEYGNFKIIANEGKYSRLIAVLESEPSTIFEDAMRIFVQTFEKKFKLKISSDQPGNHKYEGSDYIIEKTFDLFLIDPLNLIYDPENSNETLSSLERDLLKYAKKLFDKSGYVLIPKIVDGMIESGRIKKKGEGRLIELLHSLHLRNYLVKFETSCP